MKRLALVLAVLLAAPARADEAATLHALFEAEWEWTMEQNPTWASSLGDRRWNDRWKDLSEAAHARRKAHVEETLARLGAIDRTRLSPEDRLNAELFEEVQRGALEEHAHKWHLVRIDQRGGLQTLDDLASGLRFETLKDYEDWVARLKALPAHVEQTLHLLERGIAEKVLLPKVVLQRVPAQLEKQIVADPTKSPFWKPFERYHPSVDAEDQARLAAAAREAIGNGVVPAFKRVKEFFEKKYLPASFDQVGVWQIPNGEALYASLARRHTTTSRSPEEIHRIGLGEVARIRAEMQRTLEKTGFKGSLQDFFKFLRTEKRFYYDSPEALLEGYRAISKKIDPALVKVFRKLPRTPYGVEAIPDKIAPDTTTAYYRGPAADGSRAGTYFVNLYRPEVRPKWEMMALSLHEGVPGHHLQIAIALELEGVPRFRKHGGWTAYVEGWGLYAESLGEDMGLYDDPYAKFGQLTYEMWRAVRLVVDTGMHALRWDRKKAIDFFLENAPKTEHDVVNEIDRYIAMPGQALAYKIGELKLKELRARGARELGDKWDLREYHDVVLGAGPLPLTVLERRVDAWLASKKKKPWR